jgi:hypothetical protein
MQPVSEMKTNVGRDSYILKALLVVIAVLLGVLVLKAMTHPVSASAQSDNRSLYVEPRTYMLRRPDGRPQVEGKVVIDLHTGDVWGFPTLSSAPYPVDATSSKPLVSEPIYLGRFDFSKMKRTP